MSEDQTKIIGDSDAERTTRPGIEAVLDRINKLDEELRGEAQKLGDELRTEVQKLGEELRGGIRDIHSELRRIDIRLDRLESLAHAAKSDVADLRASFKEWQDRLKEPVAK
ncbi:MAG TPA: hypothetical protein VNO70_18730 [Blastocatellia bacterium]|nr:hypothetical protein [Blastocatellia bacterium]